MAKNPLPRRRLHSFHWLRLVAVILFSALVLGLIGCARSLSGFAPGPSSSSKFYWQEPGTDPPTSLAITPVNSTISSGQQIAFKAIMFGGPNTHVTWASSEGSISAQGVFTAPSVLSPKLVTITAWELGSHFSTQGTTTITVVPGLTSASKVTITTQALPRGVSGVPYSAAVSAKGGQPPYTWSLASGTFPSGITFSSNSGMIEGSPTQAGTFALGLKVVDALGSAATQEFGLTVANSSTGSTCGPPAYPCSRTDLDLVPLPSPIPSVGNLTGANSGITDPDFHNPIERLTDANTNPNAPNITFVAAAGGSSNANTWNVDSSLIFLQDTNGTGYPMTFDPTTLHAARMFVSAFPKTGGMTIPNNHFSWSRVNPNFLYVLASTQILLYDFTNRTVPPTPQLVYDFTSSPNCLPSGFRPTWQDFGGISAGDSEFAEGLSNTGQQGTGTFMAVYTVGQGCTVVNTQTGQVTSDWGQTGIISTPERFTLHDAFLTKSSGWAILGFTNCLSSACSSGPYFWQVGTTTVTPCGAGGAVELCGGHWTFGYSHWANNDGDPFGQYHFRSFADLGSFTPMVASLPVGFAPPVDQHPSWNNVDPDDSVPFISSTWTTISPFTSAWQNEILAISPTTGVVSRFAHNFITAASQRFDDQEAIGQVSQDGRFFLFNSDWMGTLGSESGSSQCTISKDCRGDVFVVQLN